MKLFVAVLLLLNTPAFAESAYTQQMFQRALAREVSLLPGKPERIVTGSMSPWYVLIKLRNPHSGRVQEVCTAATFLLGAIEREYHLENVEQRRAYDVAVAAPNRIFTFRTWKARNNVQPWYTIDQLSEVRRQLAGKTRQQLRSEVERETSDVTEIYRRFYRNKPGFWQSNELRDATAHVLLERGILVGCAHRTGDLYLAR